MFLQSTPGSDSKGRRKSRSAFTLVELVVVITILAILGTIGFLSVGGYSSRARDSERLADVAQLTKSLDLSVISAGNYPTPDNYFTVTYSGSAVWYQGVASNGVIQQLHTSIAGGGLAKKPVDPLKNTDYIYSTLAEGKAYQVEASYEGDLSAYDTSFINQAYAAPGDPTIAYVRWNYGWLIAKASTGTTVYVLAVPSIVTGSGITAGSTVTASSLSGALLFNGKTVKNSNSFNPSTVIFTGSKINPGDTGLPANTADITAMMSALQIAYTGSDIKNVEPIASILNATGSALITLGTGMVKDQLGGNASSTTVDTSPLYTFTAHTFTNCGTTGNTGPSLATCRSSYNATEVNAWKNTYLGMSTNGIQEWTVPLTASYRIEANGAAGGNSNNWWTTGGAGAKIIGTFNLSKGDKIKILVGQIGSNDTYEGGGGGGSFVTTISNSPLVIASGGGGSSASGFYGAGTKQGQTTTSGSNSNNSGISGGTGGSGGGGASNAGGGGGLTGNGAGVWAGQSFVSGGLGGTNWSAYIGGFGWGGAGGGTNGAGGGGGYSGGAACPWSYDAGAGGSYNGGTSPSATAGSNTGNGTVIITKL